MDDQGSLLHAQQADRHVRSLLHPAVYHHSIRTFLLGCHAADADGYLELDTEALQIAALFHDSGTSEEYNSDARFEVDGADAAARFLQSRDWSTQRIDDVWEAVALHTTPGIPERRSAVAHYLRRGVQIDFDRAALRRRFTAVVTQAEVSHPRGDIEEVLSGLVVAQALQNPTKAARPSWAADLVAHHDPHRDGINPAF